MSIGPGPSWGEWPWPRKRAPLVGGESRLSQGQNERCRRPSTTNFSLGSRLHNASPSFARLNRRKYQHSSNALPRVSISGMTGLFEIDSDFGQEMSQEEKSITSERRPKTSNSASTLLGRAMEGHRKGRRALTSHSRRSASSAKISKDFNSFGGYHQSMPMSNGIRQQRYRTSIVVTMSQYLRTPNGSEGTF